MTVCWCLQTQQAMDNVGVPGLLQAYEAKGANHLEQGNHYSIRRAFRQIFSRDEQEFNTPIRQ